MLPYVSIYGMADVLPFSHLLSFIICSQQIVKIFFYLMSRGWIFALLTSLQILQIIWLSAVMPVYAILCLNSPDGGLEQYTVFDNPYRHWVSWNGKLNHSLRGDVWSIDDSNEWFAFPMFKFSSSSNDISSCYYMCVVKFTGKCVPVWYHKTHFTKKLWPLLLLFFIIKKKKMEVFTEKGYNLWKLLYEKSA